MLAELQNLEPHEHILTHITAWSEGENCYILFPLARMNLREFLKEKQRVADSKLTLWLLRQMKGLADAINWIHNLDNYVPGTHLQLPGSARQTERKQGYHHDLKPENMLLFYPGTDYTEGSLKVSDFGMGKVNRVPLGSQIISRQTSTPSGTLTYESPDFEMHKKIGRPHDVWALGCVLLELLCWLFIAPYSGGKSFQTDRRGPVRSGDSDIIGDSYYHMTTKHEVKTPKLKSVVVKWMSVIEANPSCVDEFRLILELIRKPEGLLEPDMKTRMPAGTLNNVLKKILQSATERLDTAPDHYAGNVAQARKVTGDSVEEQVTSPTYTPMLSRQASNSWPPPEATVSNVPTLVIQGPE
jgi:serine/threonine protein kinase